MSHPFDDTTRSQAPHDRSAHDPASGRHALGDDIPLTRRAGGPGGRRGTGPLADLQRKPWLLAGLALALLLIAVLAYNTTGARGARRELRSATQNILDKRAEVEVARQTLEQRLAELREAEAAAYVENEKLDVELVRDRKSGAAAGTLAPELTDEGRAAVSLQRAEAELRARDSIAGLRRP